MVRRELGKVLVTGADGFIGSHLVERLVTMGVDTTALCVYNSEGHPGWLADLVNKSPPNLRVVLGDVRDAFQMEEITRGQSTIFHLAALIAIPYSYVAPQSYIDTNVSGTLNMLQAARKAKVSRFVHTSTSEVYGTARTVPIAESHPLQGQSPYSASKVGADMLVESFWRSFELPATILRPFNTFGPRQSYRAVIPTVIGQLLAGKGEVRLGSVHPTRDFNFVSNTVDAFIALGTASDVVLGDVFNAGSGREISVGDLAMLIARQVGVDVQILCEADRLRPDKSEVERLLADASKLTTATGWLPRVSLEDGLERTISWQREKRDVTRSLSYQR